MLPIKLVLYQEQGDAMRKYVVNLTSWGLVLGGETVKRLRSVGKCSPPIGREDNDLVRIVEEIGPAASGKGACLTVVSVRDDAEIAIVKYPNGEALKVLNMPAIEAFARGVN